jgi:hypothetical protein
VRQNTTDIVDITITTQLVRAAEQHATRLQFYQDKELNVTAKLIKAVNHNNHELFLVSRIIGASYNEQHMFHELLVAWPRFSVCRATWEQYSVMAVDVSEMMTKFLESHNDPDIVS